MPTTTALDVRSLILDEVSDATPVKTKPKSKPKPTFTVVMADGCDIAVRKETKATSRLLVLLVSQQQYYVKDERSGVVTKLDGDVLKGFLAGTKCVEIGSGSWLGAIWNTKKCIGRLLMLLDDEEFTCALRHGNATVLYGNTNIYPDCSMFFTSLKTKLSQWFAREFAKRYDCPLSSAIRATISRANNVWYQRCELPYWDLDVICAIESALGLDNGRKLLAAYLDAGLDRMPTVSDCMTRTLFNVGHANYVDGHGYRSVRVHMFTSQDVIHNVNLSPRSFNINALIEYAVWAIYREGYADCPNAFWEQWGACYSMEEQLYGHVRTKYPEHLASHHQQLSYLMRIHEAEFLARRDAAARAKSERLWTDIAERLRPYRYESGHYLITSPESAVDMIDEARMQSNCLASYVKLVERGERMIFFMREVANPTQSLVTIEVTPDGHVGQVKAKNNADPSREELAFVDEWAATMGLER